MTSWALDNRDLKVAAQVTRSPSGLGPGISLTCAGGTRRAHPRLPTQPHWSWNPTCSVLGGLLLKAVWVFENQICFCSSQRTYFNLQVFLPAIELQGKAESSAEGPPQENSTGCRHHAGLPPPSPEKPGGPGTSGKPAPTSVPLGPRSLLQMRGTFHEDAGHGDAGRPSALPLRGPTVGRRPRQRQHLQRAQQQQQQRGPRAQRHCSQGP